MWLKQSVTHPFLNWCNLCCSIRWCSAISSATGSVMNSRSIRYQCKWQLPVAQAGCSSVPFAFICSREIPKTELRSFLGHGEAEAVQLLRGPCILYSMSALSILQLRLDSAFGDPWSRTSCSSGSWPWVVPPQGPQPAAERSCSSPGGTRTGCPGARRQLWSICGSQAWLSRAPVAV